MGLFSLELYVIFPLTDKLFELELLIRVAASQGAKPPPPRKIIRPFPNETRPLALKIVIRKGKILKIKS